MNTGMVAATLEAQLKGQLARLPLAEVAIPDSPDMGRLWRGSGAAVVGFHSTEDDPHHPPRSHCQCQLPERGMDPWHCLKKSKALHLIKVSASS